MQKRTEPFKNKSNWLSLWLTTKQTDRKATGKRSRLEKPVVFNQPSGTGHQIMLACEPQVFSFTSHLMHFSLDDRYRKRSQRN